MASASGKRSPGESLSEVTSTRHVVQPQPSIEDRITKAVERVGHVRGMKIGSPLYWASIDLLAKNEVARAIFYGVPDSYKLHYLKRVTKEINVPEAEPSDRGNTYEW